MLRALQKLLLTWVAVFCIVELIMFLIGLEVEILLEYDNKAPAIVYPKSLAKLTLYGDSH